MDALTVATFSARAWLKSRRIAVLMGGRSAERPISLKTGKAIFSSLRRQGFSVVGIDAGPTLPETLKRRKINFAYLALHGTKGEDGVVQGLLEWMGIPYTGSGVLASALAMDKIASKQIFDSARLQSAPWFPLTESQKSSSLTLARQLGFPLVVKPASQGSAFGVSIVHAAKEWDRALQTGFKFGATLLVEKYLAGPEITIGLLGDTVLPSIEIVPADADFYDFKAKYAPGGSRHILPARLAAPVLRRANELALAAARALGTRGAVRVDLIVDKEAGPNLLEVNTIPGMTQTSLLPDAARAAGMSFDELVFKIAELAHA